MRNALLARFARPVWHSLPGAPAIGTKVCLQSDLQPGRPIYVDLGGTDAEFLCYVVLLRSVVRVFRANCPHRDRPMGSANRLPLYGDGEIACQHHGALFSLETGRGTRGPCKGERLCPVPVHCDEDWIVVGPAPRK